MSSFGVAVLLVLPLAGLQGANLSREQADSFARKIVRIQEQADTPSASPRRTTVTETELNAWFTHHAPPLLPDGIAQPRVTIAGGRRVTGTAIVDLDAVARARATGSLLDPWSYIGGRMPVTVSGLLHAEGGRARFDVQEADVSGVPIPRRVLEELVQYYTRSPERPSGVRLTDTFELPAGITQVELRPGTAVVVQ